MTRKLATAGLLAVAIATVAACGSSAGLSAFSSPPADISTSTGTSASTSTSEVPSTLDSLPPVAVTSATLLPVPPVRTTKAVAVVKAPVVTKAVPRPAPAPPAETVYSTCVALNAVYPHGVGRTGAVDHVSGSSKPVTNFTVNTALYNANASHDGDGDGIACEKD